MTFSVQEGWKIPDDSVAYIVSSGLLAAVAIDIQEGRSSTPLRPGAEIQGSQEVDLFASVSSVLSSVRH